MEDCDKTQFNYLVNQELERLNDLLHAQDDDNDEVVPYNDGFQGFGSYNNLTEKLQQWYWRHNPLPDAMNELLQILNDEGLGVPICVDGMGRGKRSKVQPFNEHTWSSYAQRIKKDCPKSNDSTIIQIQDQQKQMNAKLQLLMQEISIAKTRIDINEGLTDEMIKNAHMFPIKNVAELKAFEKSINDNNMSEHVTTLKRIIKNEEMNKSLARILSQKILLDHNLNGRNNKLALNAYPKFLQILSRAYDNFDSNSEFTMHLKEAIKRAKSRYHKWNWKHKQKNQSGCKKFKSDDAEDETDSNEEDLSLDIY